MARVHGFGAVGEGFEGHGAADRWHQPLLDVHVLEP